VVIEGQVGEITLNVPPPPVGVPVVPPPEAPAPHISSTGPLLVKIGFGTAIAGALVVTIAGAEALSKANKLPGECANQQCDGPRGGTADLKSAYGWATAANVAFAVGSAGVVVGLVGLWRSRSTTATVGGASVSPWVGLGGAGLDGRF
jgi:hypothetical protein